MRPQPGGQKRVEVLTSSRHHGHTGITRHSPRNGFNRLLRALPGDRAFLSPSPKRIAPQRLDASVEASGPHDFAVRICAVRQERIRVHRIPPRVRDDREPPPLWDGTVVRIFRSFDPVKPDSKNQKQNILYPPRGDPWPDDPASFRKRNLLLYVGNRTWYLKGITAPISASIGDRECCAPA
jgi:hypothetical protein